MKDQFKETCSCGCNLQQDQWGTCIAPSYPKFAQATSRYSESFVSDTGEGSKLVHRRKRPKVDTLFSDASERRV